MQTHIEYGSGCIFYLYVRCNVLIRFNTKLEHFTAGSEGLLWGKTDNLWNCLLKGNLYIHVHFISAHSWICILHLCCLFCVSQVNSFICSHLSKPCDKASLRSLSNVKPFLPCMYYHLLKWEVGKLNNSLTPCALLQGGSVDMMDLFSYWLAWKSLVWEWEIDLSFCDHQHARNLLTHVRVWGMHVMCENFQGVLTATLLHFQEDLWNPLLNKLHILFTVDSGMWKML